MTYRFFSLLVLLLTVLCSPVHATQPTLDQMIGQMLMAGFRGFTVDEASPIVRDIRDSHLGGVILFDYDVELGKAQRNIQSPEQVQQLTSALKEYTDIPLFVAVDQEGGRVQRLKPAYGFAGTPSAQQLGEEGEAAIRAAAMVNAYTVSKSGFNMNFAPVADVNVDPESPAIGKIGRSFSSDPERVAQCDTLFLEEFDRQGVIGCLKHFPGHGSAGADSHKGLTDVTNTWSEAELIPYRRLIEDGQAQMIMTAHIFNANLDADYPATLSHKIITGILREKLGFDGVIVTDDMNMQAIAKFYGLETALRLAIEAGADILLFGNNLTYDPDIVKTAHGIIAKLVREGTISKERIAQSYARIMRLKKNIK